jgi:hypothetical protein
VKLAPTRFPPAPHPRAGSTVEYILVLGLVVIPLALLVPLLTTMIVNYGHRIIWVVRSPFG